MQSCGRWSGSSGKGNQEIEAVFPRCNQRLRATHGYKAVHFVVYHSGLPVEVQLRTILQHAWAELSEKLADVLDPTVKYGGGPENIRIALARLSTRLWSEEEAEENLLRLREADTDGYLAVSLEKREEVLRQRKLQLHDTCRELIIQLEVLRKQA